MKVALATSLDKRESADLLVLPFWEGPIEAAEGVRFKKKIQSILNSGDFTGKLGEGALSYLEDEKEPRLLLLGLGKQEKATAETLRRAYSNAMRVAQGKKAKSLNILFPVFKAAEKEAFLRGVGEGIFLTNYAFTHLKNDSLKESPVVLLDKISFIGLDKKEGQSLEKIQTISSGVYFVRELVNGNADDVNSRFLVETALSLEKASPRLKTTIFDKKRLEQEKMGLLLAVNRASSQDPFLIQTAYRGDPKSKEHIVLVGKGITYDTGGLSLKPTEGMLGMKADMAGAATVLGAVLTAASLGLKVNVTAIAPIAENCIGSKSYKLGDVYRSHSGKTIEINNTDAEGRLVLADAISFAIQNLKPTCIIDLATLTGAIVIALGEEISGLFANEEELAKDLMAASEKSGELLWRMPLYADYKEGLKSEFADMVNFGGRDGGAVKAALFIQEFVGTIPWAHIDFAGSAYLTKPKYYNPTRATGYGIRLLIDFLERRSSP